METETFYGVTLNEKTTIAEFEATEKDMEEKLIIRQVILGADAVDGEFNVVEAQINNIKIPIAVLKVGETRMLKPNVEFPNASVTFKLIQGTGPVYIHGQHVVNETCEADGYYEEEEGTDEDDGQPQTNGKNQNTNKKTNHKVK